MLQQSKSDVINGFNPNGPGLQGKLFGLPFSAAHAEVIVIPVPWEVTVSYQAGTAQGPQAVLNASSQVDLHFRDIEDAWKIGIAMHDFPNDLLTESNRLRAQALLYINELNAGAPVDTSNPILHKINEACEALNVYIKSTTSKYLKEGKLVGLLGGDHSIPNGFLRTLSEQHDRFGILQIDAHADLRKAYEGFAFSHASVMYNALKIPGVNRLVQVGIRDLCEEEENVMKRAMGRVVTFYDDDMKAQQFQGKTWDRITDEIVNALPDLVYISFDIDGLDPKLCPSTGTPVAGGLEFEQATFLLKKLVASGRKIIGFDLSEVAPGKTEWDANVGARLLYHLCNRMAQSNGRIPTSH